LLFTNKKVYVSTTSFVEAPVATSMPFLSVIPRVGQITGILVLFLNIILPGVGSILAGLCGGSLGCVVAGLLQMLLAPFIIGWVWSIVWGVKIWEYSHHTAVIVI
jgi:hypothetical protein